MYMNNEVHNAERLEKPNTGKRNILTIVIVVVLALILTYLILLSTGMVDRDDVKFISFLERGANSVVEVEENTEEDDVVEENEFMIVQLPMLLADVYGEEFEGKKVGCDTIYWVSRYVPNTTMPLNATLRELFAYDTDLDFMVGNYVGNQSNLSFSNAVINDGIAEIYLTGEVDDFSSECDSTRLQNQVAEAALQFPSVTGVLTYLNGELY